MVRWNIKKNEKNRKNRYNPIKNAPFVPPPQLSRAKAQLSLHSFATVLIGQTFARRAVADPDFIFIGSLGKPQKNWSFF